MTRRFSMAMSLALALCSSARVRADEAADATARADALLRGNTRIDKANETDSCLGMYIGAQLVGWRTSRVVVEEDRYLAASETWCRYTLGGPGGPETNIRMRVDAVLDPTFSVTWMSVSEQGTRNGQALDASSTVERVGDEFVLRSAYNGATKESRHGPPEAVPPILPYGFDRFLPRLLLSMPPGQPHRFRMFIQAGLATQTNAQRGAVGPQRVRGQSVQAIEVRCGVDRIVCDEAGAVLAHESRDGSFYPVARNELERALGSQAPQPLVPRGPQGANVAAGRGQRAAGARGPFYRSQVDDDHYRERLIGEQGASGLISYRSVRVTAGRANGRRVYAVALGRFDWVRQTAGTTEAYFRIDAQLDPSLSVLASRVAGAGQLAGKPLNHGVVLAAREGGLLRSAFEGGRKTEESTVEVPAGALPLGFELMFPRLLLDLEIDRPVELTLLDLGTGDTTRAIFTRLAPARRDLRGVQREATEVTTSRTVEGRVLRSQIFLEPRSGELLDIIAETGNHLYPITPADLANFPRYAQPVRLEPCDPDRGGPVLVKPGSPTAPAAPAADEPLGEGGSPADVVARLFAALARRERAVMERCVNLKEMMLRQLSSRRERETFEEAWSRGSRQLIDAHIEGMIRRAGAADQLPRNPSAYRELCKEQVRGEEATVRVRVQGSGDAIYKLAHEADGQWRVVEAP